MGAKTDYLKDKLINEVLRNINYTPAATLYLLLSTIDPTDAGLQTGEPSGGGYGRIVITFDAPSPSGETQNSALVDFGTATASWGTIGWWGVMDASTAGNMLYKGPFETAKPVNNTDPVQVPSGEIEIDET